MVHSCCAYGCTNRFKKGNGIGFFRFPRDETRRKQWIHSIRRDNWEPNHEDTRVCGQHFQSGRPSADPDHPDYVPTIFVFNQKKPTVSLYEKRKTAIEKKSKSFLDASSSSQSQPISLMYSNNDVQGIQVIQPGTVIKKRPRLKATAVPSCYLPVTLPTNLEEDKLKKSVKKDHNTVTNSLQSEVHRKQSVMPNTKNRNDLKGSDDQSKMNDNQTIAKQLQMSETATEDKNTSDSEEDINENLLETIFDSSNIPCPTDNAEEFLKRKIEAINEKYEKAYKKMKLYQRKCQLYAKQSMSLKEVIDSLKQINSVPNCT